jgi:putative ABC transport system permease protein
MNDTAEIGLPNLLLGFSILIIPLLVFLYYRVRLVNDLFISVIRMVIQLFLVALYLELIFDMNNPWINSLWVLIMIIIGAGTTVSRINIRWGLFFAPFILAGLLSMAIVDGFFIGAVIRLEYFFDARYFIPISGMVLGNSINHNIVGLTAYFEGLSNKKELYYFILTNSGSRKQAIRPYIQDALVKGLNPLLATMSVIGLISLPGMMTGQILGGASPVSAIKYQVMIMIAIFAGCTMILIMSILYSNFFVFDDYDNIRPLMRKKAFKDRDDNPEHNPGPSG